MAARMLVMLTLLLYQTEARTPFTGDGVGGAGSRACRGGLRVRPHTLDWSTSWSDCERTPYDTISQGPGKFVYRLHPRGLSCKMRVLEVQHTDDAWVATGFPTETAWRKKAYEQETACVYD